MTSGVAALWSHRNSLRILVRRDLAVKYQQSVLGYFWSLIEPLGMGADLLVRLRGALLPGRPAGTSARRPGRTRCS